MENRNNLTQRVICEVYQIIEMMPQKEKEQIPQEIRRYFKENAKDNDKYIVDPSIPIDKQNLDEKTYTYVYMLTNYIKRDINYYVLEPHWEKIENKEEKIKKIDEEIQINLYNINNTFADRKLIDKEFVLNINYFGLTTSDKNLKILEPFIILCRLYIAVHNDYEKNKDYDKALKYYTYIVDELKKNINEI